MLPLSISLKEIQLMPYEKFKKILKEKIKERAFSYLTNKIRSKGKENDYKILSMDEYLLPENKLLTIEEKQRLFEIKHRMTKIPSNFSNNIKFTCVCGNEENMEHIYYCKILSEEKEKTLKFDKIITEIYQHK